MGENSNDFLRLRQEYKDLLKRYVKVCREKDDMQDRLDREHHKIDYLERRIKGMIDKYSPGM